MMIEKQNRNTGHGRIVRFFAVSIILLAVTFVSASASAETSTDDEVKALRETVEALMKKVEKLESLQTAQTVETRQQKASIATISKNLDEIESAPQNSFGSVFDKLHVGGYGELHANFGEGKDADVIDLHRLVLYLGYDFADWIQFHSEFEIEHGFVNSDDATGGEFVVEQAYFDFLLSDALNVRAGRILTPLAITNKYHEPTSFNSVERPSFDKFIIPSTWSSDGIGLFGALSDNVTYEAYVVGGLDGNGFDKNGIRGGRIKERPSLHEPAFTGRLDYTAIDEVDESLRLGFSAYAGGLDNTNNSSGLTGVDADIRILSADFNYSISKFDFLGAIAKTSIDGAKNLAGNAVNNTDNVASESFGWYIEGAYHWWPESWKKGKFTKTDAVVFARYDDFDTQYDMPSGFAANPAGDRNEITIGTAIRLTPNFVVKADYQFRDDKTSDKLGDKINFGIGFSF
ncbi:MAG: hypothetical protein FVQ82_16075 [Planctomycetes bacterium]|nr:hypothetical protein [Planctomycetota bacterium]